MLSTAAHTAKLDLLGVMGPVHAPWTLEEHVLGENRHDKKAESGDKEHTGAEEHVAQLHNGA